MDEDSNETITISEDTLKIDTDTNREKEIIDLTSDQ